MAALYSPRILRLSDTGCSLRTLVIRTLTGRGRPGRAHSGGDPLDELVGRRQLLELLVDEPVVLLLVADGR